MFLPSEAVYAELHATFRNVVEDSFRRRVWIVSPTTLMATLNTIRAVLKDAKMREQAGVIQAEVVKMMDDVTRLDKRVGNLQSHFDLAVKDVREIRISTDKIVKKGEKSTPCTSKTIVRHRTSNREVLPYNFTQRRALNPE